VFLTAFSTRVSVLSSKTYNGDDTIKDLRSELSWVGQINYIAQKAWNALHFVMRVLKKKQKKNQEYKQLSLHVNGMSYS